MRRYHPLKESIDVIRVSLGLPRLPSLQEESDKILSKYVPSISLHCDLFYSFSYLEQRRKNWNDESNNNNNAPVTRNSKKRKKG